MSVIKRCTECGSVALTVEGQPYSKANSRRLIYRDGKPMFIKSNEALAYSNDFKKQCPVLPQLITEDLRIGLHLFYKNKKPDLDESLVLDLLQERVIKNDRQVKEKHVYWHLDPERPRSTILLSSLEVSPCGSVNGCCERLIEVEIGNSEVAKK